MRRKGFTIVELLVATAITVLIVSVMAYVFQICSEVVSKTTANNNIMKQLKAITSQLDADFDGLRSDMPIAIMFESHSANDGPDRTLGDPDDPQRIVRYDRIVFFANGDFQTLKGDYSGNMARIFYGQTKDIKPLPSTTVEPPRKILSRRRKILTADANWLYDFSAFTSPELYDYVSMECTTVASWKNVPFVQFAEYYYNPSCNISSIQRPSISAAKSIGGDAVQKLYMLPDVTDFRIQIWHNDRWFPNDRDIRQSFGQDFAFCWNIKDIPNYPFAIHNTTWWTESSLKNIDLYFPLKAARFTFTLYGKDRRHFPEGRTYTYIIELPDKA